MRGKNGVCLLDSAVSDTTDRTKLSAKEILLLESRWYHPRHVDSRVQRKFYFMEKNVKKILCYGDSNTWGEAAFSRGRMEHDEQWPNVLQGILGADYRVVQEGLSARIAGDYEETKPHRNGQRYFEVAFRTASPVDLVVIALGVNDMKKLYQRTPEQIVADLLWYQEKTRELVGVMVWAMPQILYLLPHAITPSPYFNGHDMSREVAELMQQKGVQYIAPGEPGSDLETTKDGVHLTSGAHHKVAALLAQKMTEMEL